MKQSETLLNHAMVRLPNSLEKKTDWHIKTLIGGCSGRDKLNKED